MQLYTLTSSTIGQDHNIMPSDRQSDLRPILQIQRCAEEHDLDLLRNDCRQRLALAHPNPYTLQRRLRVITPIKTRDRYNA
jgi:hypothetical protein